MTDLCGLLRRYALTVEPMEAGFKNVATRMVAAETNFVEVLMALGDITKAQAEHVLAVYRKLKLLKRDVVGGRISVTHGAYLDKDTITKALTLSR